jgi:ribosomal protein S27AE
MRSNETVRYECGDCRFVFDLTLDPVREAELAEELGLEVEALDPVEPTSCPFCGAGVLRAVHDSPTQVPVTYPPGGA